MGDRISVLGDVGVVEADDVDDADGVGVEHALGQGTVTTSIGFWRVAGFNRFVGFVGFVVLSEGGWSGADGQHDGAVVADGVVVSVGCLSAVPSVAGFEPVMGRTSGSRVVLVVATTVGPFDVVIISGRGMSAQMPGMRS